jgi:hypothetical protein
MSDDGNLRHVVRHFERLTCAGEKKRSMVRKRIRDSTDRKDRAALGVTSARCERCEQRARA